MYMEQKSVSLASKIVNNFSWGAQTNNKRLEYTDIYSLQTYANPKQYRMQVDVFYCCLFCHRTPGTSIQGSNYDLENTTLQSLRPWPPPRKDNVCLAPTALNTWKLLVYTITTPYTTIFQTCNLILKVYVRSSTLIITQCLKIHADNRNSLLLLEIPPERI